MSLSVSTRAKEVILSLTKKKEGSGLRVEVRAGGCHGLEYVCSVEEEPREKDKTFEFDEVKIFIDQESLFFASDVQIGYNDALTGAGFVFTNPLSTGSCGCGISFSV